MQSEVNGEKPQGLSQIRNITLQGKPIKCIY